MVLVPWDMVLERKRVQESWFIFKTHHLLKAQELFVPTKSSKGRRRPAWMSKELLTKLKCKEEP